MKTIFQTVIGVGGGIASALLGDWNIAMEIMLIFIVMDYITGVAVAFKAKTVQSTVGYEGLMRKAAIFLVVIVAVQLDRVAGTESFFKSATAFFFVANEGISLLENTGKLGVRFPPFIKDRLEQLRDMGNDPSKWIEKDISITDGKPDQNNDAAQE